MRPCFVVEITTPKKYILNGLWFGPKKAKRAIIFIHGLTASAFSMKRVVDVLVDKDTAILTFNNRGFEKITEIKRKKGKRTEWHLAGAAHEVFTECADDIEGAVRLARRAGVREVYLAGHSTGCQKAFYWANKKEARGVKGIILFGPLSDYSIALQKYGKKLAAYVRIAKKMMRSGKAHELMPKNPVLWFPADAQRFVSLHSAESAEDVFPYALSRAPKLMQRVRIPTLALLAGADEHGDRPAKEIGKWFEKNLRAKNRVAIIPRVGHSFRGGEKRVAQEIRRFIGR
jgi:alpha-beta hydrolase superfamily lysophospholipase